MVSHLDPKRIIPSRTAIRIEVIADSSTPQTIKAKILAQRNPLTSFLVSLLAHTILLLGLLLIVFYRAEPIPKISVLATIETQPALANPTEIDPNTIKIEIPEDSQSPIDNQAVDTALDTKIEIAETHNTVNNAVAENKLPNVSNIESPVSPKMTLPTGGGLTGRTAKARGQLAAARGGSRASEMAVEAGLRWILAHQRDDGSWRFHHDDGHCDGACLNEGMRESTTAATGLSLLALLGAGYTHRTGPHQQPVQKGLDYLLGKVRYTPHGGILAEGKDGMYAQAIATMALAESYTMTGDTNLMNAINEAKKYIVAAQHRNGSWGYNAGTPGDTTLTGWQLMALKSCQRAGFPTTRPTWENAEKFIDSMGTSQAAYGYKSPETATPATTAVGLLSKMYLGMPREHRTLADGGRLLSKYGPSETDVYFNYYATQVLHHRHGPDWKTWNVAMRDYLINRQVTGQKHADGSWYFPDQHGAVGGRLYTTAMAVMILEVYYRYLPLYEDEVLEVIEIEPERSSISQRSEQRQQSDRTQPH